MTRPEGTYIYNVKARNSTVLSSYVFPQHSCTLQSLTWEYGILLPRNGGRELDPTLRSGNVTSPTGPWLPEGLDRVRSTAPGTCATAASIAGSLMEVLGHVLACAIS